MAQETDTFLPDALIYPGQQNGLIMVVDKAEQRLFIYRHDGKGNIWLDKIVPCSTGMIQGDKLIRGDKKTPEGYYIFRQKLLSNELPDIYGILAYPMDYPNFWDRKIGRGGDGIWTHGINKTLVDYDSSGCIEMLNHDIAALENEIKLHDTPILVYDQVTFTPKEDLKKEAEDITNFIERWRRSWSEKNLTEYATYYDAAFFNTDELSYKGWMDRKARVAAGYQKIEISISDLRIFRHRDTVIASFAQDYKGDSRFKSYGYKRLYLKGDLGNWRIVAEEYGPMPSKPPEKWLTAEEKNLALTTPPLAMALLSEPVATATAGAIVPSDQVQMGDAKMAKTQTEAQAAADEEARAALEQRTSQRSGNQPTVVSSAVMSNNREELNVVADETLSEPLRVSASAGSLEEPVASAEPEPATAVPVPAAAEPEPAIAEPVPAAVETASQVTETQVALTDSKAQTEANTSTDQASSSEATNEPVTTYTSPEEIAQAEPEPPAETDGGSGQEVSGLTAEAALTLLKGWLSAWSAKNEEAYFSYYAPDFLFKDLNLHLNSFKRYRSRRFEEAGNITIEASDIQVTISGNEAKITFLQLYQSDRHRDQGVKTLELEARDGKWLIISESFQLRP
jgi:murein L,D-transpeptidase YafK